MYTTQTTDGITTIKEIATGKTVTVEQLISKKELLTKQNTKAAADGEIFRQRIEENLAQVESAITSRTIEIAAIDAVLPTE